MNKVLQTFQEGLSIDKIEKTLDGVALFVGYEKPPFPSVLLLAKVNDNEVAREIFLATSRKLVATAGEWNKPIIDIGDIEGVETVTLFFRDPPVTVYMATPKGYAVVTNSKKHLLETIKRLKSGTSKIADNELSRMLKTFQGKPSLFVFNKGKKIFPVIQELSTPTIAKNLPKWNKALGLNAEINKLPPSESVAKYLKPSIEGISSDKNGIYLNLQMGGVSIIEFLSIFGFLQLVSKAGKKMVAEEEGEEEDFDLPLP